MTESLTGARMNSALPGRQQVALGFDGPRAHQHLPVGGAGDGGKGRGRADQLGAGLAQGAVELRETQVVADGQAEPADRGIDHHHLGAVGIVVGLAVAAAVIGHIDVEQVDLVVARHPFALFVDQ
ncbi:hypothetical protein D3C78_537880 [compost metagenome]